MTKEVPNYKEYSSLVELAHIASVAYTNHKSKMFEKYINEKHRWYITQNPNTWIYEVRYMDSDFIVSELEVDCAYQIFNDNYPTPQRWIEMVANGEIDAGV